MVPIHRFPFLLITALSGLFAFTVLENGFRAYSQDSLVLTDSTENDSTIDTNTAVAADSSATDTAHAVVKTAPSETVVAEKGTHKKNGLIILHNLKRIFRITARYFKHFLILIMCMGIILYTISFFRKKADNKRFLTSTRLSVMNREVQIACNYMEKYFANPDLTLQSICEALVTGPAFLEALFQRELGMSVSDFLLHVRINRAKKILEKIPSEPADEVALNVGFIDYKQFLRNFSDITGISFEEYQSSLNPNA